MNNKNKKKVFFQRLFFWSLYLLSGFVIYLEKGYLHPFLIIYTRILFPLSIFWLQIRIKKRTKFLPINSSMTTSELWFNILPVIGCLFAVIFSITNLFLYILKYV